MKKKEERVPTSVIDEMKLSQLIRLGVADMKAVIEEGHDIDMSIWLDVPNKDYPTCTACMAGAVMLNSVEGVEDKLFDERNLSNYDREMCPVSFGFDLIGSINNLSHVALNDLDEAINTGYSDDISELWTQDEMQEFEEFKLTYRAYSETAAQYFYNWCELLAQFLERLEEKYDLWPQS